MRSRLPISLLLFTLLGACADAGCLASRSSPDVDQSACVGAALITAAPTPERTPAAPKGSVAYTDFAAPSAKGEVIQVRIDAGFDDSTRAAVARALDEWNHVLNGHVKLVIGRPYNNGPTPLPYVKEDKTAWMIGRVNGTGPGIEQGNALRKGAFSRALAQTHDLAGGGHLVLVFSDRVNARDFNGILLHELGHAFGLAHDEGLLMAPHYSASKQRCVDRAAVQALAQRRGLPFGELNWCSDAGTVNQAMNTARSLRVPTVQQAQQAQIQASVEGLTFVTYAQ
jgi:hypothetical protein